MNRIAALKIKYIFILSLAFFSPPIVFSQGLPPLEIVVPFAAGSATDSVARAYKNQLEKQGTRTIFISNKPGANGLIGLDYFLTLNKPANAIAVLPSTVYVADKLRNRSDARRPSLMPIGLIGTTGFALVTSKTLAKKFTVRLSENFDQSRPPSFGFASFGAEISAKLFLKTQSFNGIGAQYKTAAGVITDLLNGTIDFAFIDTFNAHIACNNEMLSIIAITAEPQICGSKSTSEVVTTSSIPRVESWFLIVAHPQVNQSSTSLNFRAAITALAESNDMRRLGVNFRPIYDEDLTSYLDQQVVQWAAWFRDFSNFEHQ